MRKYGTLVLALILVLSFVGCNNKEAESPTDSAVTYYDGETTTRLNRDDIAAAVAQGSITVAYEATTAEAVTKTTVHGEVKQATVTLGMESSALTDAIADSGYDANQHRKIGENYIRYECGNSLAAYFYYTNDDRQNGLAAVVSFGTAYGFEPKVTTKEDVVSVMGTPRFEGTANEKAMSMFLFFEPGYTYIDYISGTNHVSFFFHENGTLGATVIYQDGLWIY